MDDKDKDYLITIRDTVNAFLGISTAYGLVDARKILDAVVLFPEVQANNELYNQVLFLQKIIKTG